MGKISTLCNASRAPREQPPARAWPWLPCLRRCSPSAAARGRVGETSASRERQAEGRARGAAGSAYGVSGWHETGTLGNYLFENEMNTEVTPPPTPPRSPVLHYSKQRQDPHGGAPRARSASASCGGREPRRLMGHCRRKPQPRLRVGAQGTGTSRR